MKRRLNAIFPILMLLLALLAAAGFLRLQRSTVTPEEASPLHITELMCRNSASVTDHDGSFCQWIELRNVSETVVELSDYSLEHGSLRATLPARGRGRAPRSRCAGASARSAGGRRRRTSA